jgi:hypothetical protein
MSPYRNLLSTGVAWQRDGLPDLTFTKKIMADAINAF